MYLDWAEASVVHHFVVFISNEMSKQFLGGLVAEEHSLALLVDDKYTFVHGIK